MTSGIAPLHLVITVIVLIVVVALVGYLVLRVKRGGKRRD